MSEQNPLERVIAEQQSEIDRLRRLEASNLDYARKQYDQRERVVDAAFALLNAPTSQGARDMLRKELVAWGYCILCQRAPCECEYDG